MPKYAPHVYTEQAQIATLEHWVKLLDGQERVRIELDDGSMIAGTVAVHPMPLGADPQVMP